MKKYIVFVVVCIGVACLWLLSGDIKDKEAARHQVNILQGEPVLASKSSDYKVLYPKQYETYTMSKDDKFISEMYDIEPKIAVLRMGEGDIGTWWGHHRGKFYGNIDLMFNVISEMPKNANDDSEYPYSRCLSCHSSDTLRLIDRDGKMEFFSRPLAAYGHEAQNTVGCLDCHDPKTMQLSMRRDYLDKGLVSAGMKEFKDSTHQEKRSLLCAQCHVLSYTKREQWIDQNGTTREAKLIALPWSKGLSVEETEVYYDDGSNFPDGKPSVHIVNEFSKAPTILAEHPDFELFQKGVHAKNGVACADCHLPYASEGGSKFTHHSMSKPLENMDKSCLNCHGNKEKQLREIVAEKKQRVDTLGKKTLDNLAKAHLEAKKAWEAGAKEEEMKEALNFIRKAQWRYSYVRSSFGAYFHATDESLRIYGDANDYAQKARIEIIKVLAKHGVIGYEAPEFQTKEEVFKYANLPNRENFIKEKCEWIYATGRKWLKEAKEKGTLSEELYGIENSITWHDLNCKK